MSRVRLVKVLAHLDTLRPLDARKLALEWRVIWALDRGGHLRPLTERRA